MKMWLLLLLLLLFHPVMKGDELKSGDLIFVGECNSDFSKAITEATSWGDSLKLVHVAIVEVGEKGEVNVIEASPQEGVRIVPYEKFIEEVPKVDEEPLILVERLNIKFPVEECISRAKSFIGEPYDWWYLPHNGKMYCSELVYESYLDSNGEHIFKTVPMNFRSADGKIPQFWIDLFEELGEPIPEGVAGSNPSDLAKSSCLYKVSL